MLKQQFDSLNFTQLLWALASASSLSLVTAVGLAWLPTPWLQATSSAFFLAMPLLKASTWNWHHIWGVKKASNWWHICVDYTFDWNDSSIDISWKWYFKHLSNVKSVEFVNIVHHIPQPFASICFRHLKQIKHNLKKVTFFFYPMEKRKQTNKQTNNIWNMMFVACCFTFHHVCCFMFHHLKQTPGQRIHPLDRNAKLLSTAAPAPARAAALLARHVQIDPGEPSVFPSLSLEFNSELLNFHVHFNPKLKKIVLHVQAWLLSKSIQQLTIYIYNFYN